MQISKVSGKIMWDEPETTFNEADAISEAYQNAPEEDELLEMLELEF